MAPPGLPSQGWFFLNQAEFGYVNGSGKQTFHVWRAAIGRMEVNPGAGYVRILNRAGREAVTQSIDHRQVTPLLFMAHIAGAAPQSTESIARDADLEHATKVA